LHVRIERIDIILIYQRYITFFANRFHVQPGRITIARMHLGLLFRQELFVRLAIFLIATTVRIVNTLVANPRIGIDPHDRAAKLMHPNRFARVTWTCYH